MAANPFARMHRTNERANKKRPRRAMTAVELPKLIDAACRRSLAEYGRKPMRVEPAEGKRRKRASWTYEPLTTDNLGECEARALERLRKRPDIVATAEAEGRLRALTYKAQVLTGLRLNELRSLTVGRVTLDGPEPYAVLRAADEKARRAADVPLRADLAADLRAHLSERLRREQDVARQAGTPIPVRLPADAPLLDVPDGLVKRFNRDLLAAGIATAERKDGK